MSNVHTLRGRDADVRIRAKTVRAAASPVSRILLPVQGTDREFLVQDAAIHLAANLGVPVYALHIASTLSGDRRNVFRYVRRRAREWSVAIETRILEATDVVAELLAEAHPTDLIVLGTRQLGGRYHVGSVAEQLILRAPCPVQVMRLPGSDAPGAK